MAERLDRLLASQGALTRSGAREIIRAGRIAVNGRVVSRPETKLDPLCDVILMDGAPFYYKKFLYLALNKPTGVVSATADARERTVLDLVPPSLLRPGLFPVGRLDKDTTGLLILSDDGGFAHRVLSPKSHVPKTYLAVLDRPPDEAAARAFAQGIPLDGERCLPAQLTLLNGCTARVVIHEGMYHQIKRMFGLCGYRVLELRRIAFGGLALDALQLAPGQCRELTPQEFSLIGGPPDAV